MITEMKRVRAMLVVLGVGLLIVPVAVDAQEVRAPAEARTIRVSSSGQVNIDADEATLRFAVETTGQTARDAARQNADLMDRVIRSLVEAGVERTDIETQNFSVYPDYARGPDQREPRITGYRATNQVMLTTTELDRVGMYIDTALDAGANRFESLSWGLQDASEARAEALRRAVTQARATGEVIAGALGVQLGAVLDASTAIESVTPSPRFMARAESMDVTAAPTPVEPGSQTVRASVTVVFGIR